MHVRTYPFEPKTGGKKFIIVTGWQLMKITEKQMVIKGYF
jgi:hypothetical protein